MNTLSKTYQSNPADIFAEYEDLQPLLGKLTDEITFAVGEYMKEGGIEYSEVVGRVKTSVSFREKIDRKQYDDPLKDMDDLAGVRIVCLFEADLPRVEEILRKEMHVLETENKADSLGDNLMGYQGRHLILRLGGGFLGPRYNQLSDLKCEIQIRTVLQDAWSKISHKLVYKNEASVPRPLRRNLNNVSSLMEVAQSVFDNVKVEQERYLADLSVTVSYENNLLDEPIDHHTLKLYSKGRFPALPISEMWQDALIDDLSGLEYHSIGDIDRVINLAKTAIDEYANEVPEIFRHSTDFLTKSIGLIDTNFLGVHTFSPQTMSRLSQLATKHGISRK